MNNEDPTSTSESASAQSEDHSKAPSTSRRKVSNRIINRIAIISLISIAGLYVLSMSSSKPNNLGVTNGQLSKCPATPNCVSTQAADPDSRMPEIPFAGDADQMLEKIKRTIATDFPRATIVSELDHYLHFEFKSLIFRFVDDVEFFVDDKASVVHFRSASRVGKSDLGVNRKRMSQISESLKQ